MQEKLAISLVEKGVLAHNEIEAVYTGKGIGQEKVQQTGSFIIEKIDRLDNGMVFHVKSTRDGTFSRTTPSQITYIDGMDPERFAEVHNINPDGSVKRRAGKKRGRKTKFDRMICGLKSFGFDIDPEYEFKKEVLSVILDEVFPVTSFIDGSKADPSEVPEGEEVWEILDSWEIPMVECDYDDDDDFEFATVGSWA